MNVRLRACAAAFVAASTLVTMASVTPAVAKGPTPKTIEFDSSEYFLWEGHPTDDSVGFGLKRSVKTGTPSVTVTVGKTGDTAASEVDYYVPETSFTATFSRNQLQITEAAIITAVSDGDFSESDETITLTLSNPSSKWNLGTQQTATVTIHEEPAPPAPVDMSAVPLGTDTLDVSWDIPDTWPGTGYPPGYPLTFTVERSIDGAEPWTVVHQGPEYSASDSGLDPGTTYTHRVNAANAEWAWSDYSETTGTTGTVPSPPTPTCSAEVDNYDPTVVHVTWTVSEEVGYPVYYYVHSSSDQQTWTLVAQDYDIYSADDTGLTDVPYYYRVIAETEAGTAVSEPCAAIS